MNPFCVGEQLHSKQKSFGLEMIPVLYRTGEIIIVTYNELPKIADNCLENAKIQQNFRKLFGFLFETY